MKHIPSSRRESNRLKSAIDLGIRAMRHRGTWAAASLAIGSGASAAPVLEPARIPALAPIDRPSAITRPLVLVDPAVERADILLSGLPSNASIVELPRDQDPLAAIGRALRMHRDIGEVHVLSHGEAGALKLGGQRIDTATLEARSEELRGWFADRKSAPAIVLYGCSAGAGEAGLSLINTLARLTGAAVSASDDATGRPADGGEWIFERSTALAARAPIFGEAARAEFEGLLATFTVTNTDDAGPDSLRQAIIDANNTPGPDIVDATGISGTITLATGQINIIDEVEINGPGPASLTVSGNDASRIFGIYADTAISDVTLTAGSTTGDGGAINNSTASTLTITGVTISDSYAGDDGGAISQYQGELIVRDSTITGNSANNDGGGIRFQSYDDTQSRLDISNTTISNNTADNDGGGIYIQVGDYAGTFEISDSTISGNTAGDQGGGIALYADSVYEGAVYAGDLTISNSTISNNTAATGGGVFVYGEEDVGDTLITGSTIRDNVAQGSSYSYFRGGSSYGLGGGVFFANDYGQGTLTILDTTVTGNSASAGGGVAVVFESYGSVVTIEDSIITNNEADGGSILLRGGIGGGNLAGSGAGVLLFNEEALRGAPYGSLTLRNTTISGNTASNAGGGLAGQTRPPFFFGPQSDTSANRAGGADGKTEKRGDSTRGFYYYDNALSEITIEGTTTAGNDAGLGGGIAIAAQASKGLSLSNSTVSGNNAGLDAGGIAIYGQPSSGGYYYYYNRGTATGIALDLDLVTIANNTQTAPAARGIITASGVGGIGLLGPNDTAVIRNSIVGDNTGSPYNDIFGNVAADFTLIEDPAGATITGGNNITSTDPVLGPLADNGGPTFTHMPALSSPALDAGDPAFAMPPATDQRGEARIANGNVDMGSVEVQPPNIAFSPDPLNFGALKVGATSPSAGVTISNTGGPLEVTSIDAAASPFAGAGTTCAATPFILNDGESCTVSYTFTPTATGAAGQTIAVASNDGDGPASFNLAGEGILGALSVTPAPVDFGTVTVGGTSGSASATLANVGPADVVVSGLSGPAAPFSLTGGTCGGTPFTIAPSASCTLDFTFSPTSTGTANGSVTVTSDASTTPDTIDLIGNGGGAPQVGLSANDLNFGTVSLGVGETDLVTLTNTGNSTLNVNQITAPGAPFSLGFGARGLSLCSTPPFNLAPAASCAIEVSFNPASPGSFNASFDIVSNAPSSPDSVALRGSAGGAPVPVPIFGAWGLALLSGLMGLVGWLGIRRRKSAPG